MNVAYINRRIITWALDRLDLEPDQIATTIMPAENIRAWERGESHPTENQAELLANKLQIPYLVLFLSEPPPPEKVPIPDLRTRSGKAAVKPSREFIAVINDALSRQDWYREQAQQKGCPKLSFVGRFKRADPVIEVAANMRSVLRINQEFRSASHNWEEFLRQLITRVENAGILVMRSGVAGHSTRRKLNINEFQGFALCDPYAPTVFINDADFRAAQIFTLAHELAHIWIGETGISDASLVRKSLTELNRIESFCNQVAAEFLVPERSFNVSWQKSRTIKENLKRVSQHFWVSSLVALRRAYDLQRIDYEQFKSASDEEYAHYRANEEKRKKAEQGKKSKGQFWATFKLRNSILFSESVATSVRSAKTTYTEASNLLGVSISTVERFLRQENAA
ncbi:MAG: ImmA/IrrE family metallo-endopeptidase [Terracidiphilus sp.]|jgi:Zn-dependent peptidase ImmA (M78 family)